MKLPNALTNFDMVARSRSASPFLSSFRRGILWIPARRRISLHSSRESQASRAAYSIKCCGNCSTPPRPCMRIVDTHSKKLLENNPCFSATKRQSLSLLCCCCCCCRDEDLALEIMLLSSCPTLFVVQFLQIDLSAAVVH